MQVESFEEEGARLFPSRLFSFEEILVILIGLKREHYLARNDGRREMVGKVPVYSLNGEIGDGSPNSASLSLKHESS